MASIGWDGGIDGRNRQRILTNLLDLLSQFFAIVRAIYPRDSMFQQ